MAIISFAKTEKEYRSGKKTVTRRDWNIKYLIKWQKWYDEMRGASYLVVEVRK